MAFWSRLNPRRVVAVDYDSSQLRLVLSERAGRRFRVLRMVGVPVPDGLDLTDARAVGTFLGESLRDARLAGVPLAMSIPRGQAVLKPLTLPPGTAEGEMPNMVRYQVAGELPFPEAEAVIDFTVTSHVDVEADSQSEPDGVSVLASAARLPVVDHYRQVAASAGGKLVRLSLRPYANLRCVSTCTVRDDSETVALVMVTPDETEIDVMDGQTLAFSRSALHKLRCVDAAADEADEASRNRDLHTVVTEVIRSLQSFVAAERASEVDAVLVAGGTGLEQEVAHMLTQRLGVPCDLLDPSGGYELRGEETASAFVSALGLAGGAETDLPFDFLHPTEPVEQPDRRRTLVLAAMASMVLLIAALVLVRMQYLGGLRAQRGEAYKERERLKDVARSATLLERNVEDVREYLDGRRDWLGHLANLSVLLPPADEAYLPGGLRTLGDGSIRFMLRVREPAVLDALTHRLREAGYEFKIARSTVVDRDPFGYPNNYEIRIEADKNAHVDLARGTSVGRPGDDQAGEVLTDPEARRRVMRRRRGS